MTKKEKNKENQSPKQKDGAQKVRQKTEKKVKKSEKKTLSDAKTAQKSRKGRSDSVAADVGAMQAALTEITPPDHVKLTKVELRFWDSIIAEFAKVEWTDHTLELAAMLARNMCSYEKAQRIIARDGELLPRIQIVRSKLDNVPDKEVTVGYYANPMKNFLKMYHENILSFRRSLSLQSRVLNGEPRDKADARDDAKKKEAALSNMGDRMSLINRPQTAH